MFGATNQNNPYHYPSSFALSAAQIAGLSSVSGLNHVVVKGGGTIDLAHLASLGITSWSIGDDGAYDIVGTDAGETVTLGSARRRLRWVRVMTRSSSTAKRLLRM